MLVELSVMEQRIRQSWKSSGPISRSPKWPSAMGSPVRRCIDGSGTIARADRGAAGPAHDSTLEPPSPRPESGGGDLRDAAPAPALGTPDPCLLARTRRGVDPVPARSTIYRVLVRNHLIVPVPRKRKRDSYVRWERGASMELWQHDFISGVRLKSGPELKVVTGIDDHSRYCVLAKVVRRATARQVCLAFTQAMSTYGIPDEVLTDNGIQFTGRLIKPQHRSEVLFERICRENEIVQRFTKVASPTTTGKIVRSWYADIAAQTPGSARSAYRLLKAIFNTAVLDDLIVKNPCRVKRGGTDRVTDRPIPNVDQVAALAQSMPEQYRAAVTLAAWGTLRRGEVLGLNRQDIDLRAGTVLVERSLHEFYDGRLELGPTKNGDPRKVYMPSSVMPALEDHLRRFVGPENDAPLFLGAPGLRLRPSNFGVIWETARRRVDLKWVRFHDLRHFAATMFASAGASTKEIMSRGGWKSVAMVVRYEQRRSGCTARPSPRRLHDGRQCRADHARTPRRSRAWARDEGEGESEVLDLPPLTSENEEKCSGGETRTHNLAVNSRLLCH